jgi:hypothetical protein
MMVGGDSGGQSNAWAYNTFNESWTKVLPGDFEGDGSAQYPYLIRDVWELQDISNDLTANYSLANDIDASVTTSWNGGEGFEPLWGFTGSLDGCGYVINKLCIHPSMTDAGLFGRIEKTGYVANLGLVDVDIAVTGSNWAGAIAGTLDGSGDPIGTISNCYASGSITGGTYLGGLVGCNFGRITDSYSTVTVTGTGSTIGGLAGYMSWLSEAKRCYATGDVSGGTEVGGLVGYNYQGVIDNSYATGDVTGSGVVGGLVGYHHYTGATIYQSYATGNVSGTDRIGGLIGEIDRAVVHDSYSTGKVTRASGVSEYSGGFVGFNYRGSVTKCYSTGRVTYADAADPTNKGFVGMVDTGSGFNMAGNFWDVDTSRQTSNAAGGANGFNTSQMKAQANYVASGWDFATVWHMAETVSYPLFQWQELPPAGSGTSADPYLIYDVYKLQSMKDNLAAHYALACDIDAACTVGWNSGAGFIPLGNATIAFSGTIEGNNHSVTGLYENHPTNRVGLFYSISNGYAGNISLLNVNLTGTTIAGGFTAAISGTTTLNNVRVTGALSSSGTWIGGLIGVSEGTITRCSANISVTGGRYAGGLVGRLAWGLVSQSHASGNVKGTESIGGLIGYIDGGTRVTDSYSTGTVTRKSGSVNLRIGGFSGMNYMAKVLNCYSTGQVIYEGTTNPTDKGLVGNVTVGGVYEMAGNFWDTETSLQSTTAGIATGLPTAQMKMQATFTGAGWDFANIWQMTEGVTYPQLRAPVFAGGIGTLVSPYLISDVSQLQAMRNNLTAHYALANDIDASITSGWNGGAGFMPVGNVTTKFVGNLDGRGFLITDLFINRPATNYIGLIGCLTTGGYIGNVSLNSASVTGKDNVGALVGHNSGGTISECYTTGSVSGNAQVGGLLGNSYSGTIQYSYSTASVVGSLYMGGLVGYVKLGTIDYSYSTGLVPTGGGGLVGGDWGGLVVTASYWDTETSGRSSSYGGLGRTTAQLLTQSTYSGWDFTNAGAWWMVDGNTRPFLRMEWSAEIHNSHQLQMVHMNLAADYVLGCNIDLSDITDPAQMWGTSTGSGAGFFPIGTMATRFAGSLDGQNHVISDLYIRRPTTDYVGLIGYTDSGVSVENVTLANAQVTGREYTGGLMGYFYSFGLGNSQILGCSVAGVVSGGGTYVGGLVGYCYYGLISQSFSVGSVSSTGFSEGTGGLVGLSDQAIINDCYSHASVNGIDKVGGFMGYSNGATITNCYSVGPVDGDTNVGGFIGYKTGGTVTASFWDYETSGQFSSAGGLGKVTLEMQTRATFEAVGWDLTNIWWAEDGYYPQLMEAGASGGGGGGSGAQFPVLSSVAWDFASGRFWACGETGGLASVHYVWPHQIDTLQPVPGTPAYSFTAIAVDESGNILVGGNGLDALHYYDGMAWIEIDDGGASLSGWNITGITYNPNDDRFYIVGNEYDLDKAAAFYTDVAPLSFGSRCYRDSSSAILSMPGLRGIEWNRLRNYGLAVGAGVYRLEPYGASTELSWTTIKAPGNDNSYLDISWDTDGWNEAAIVGRNQTSGNYWRYYDSNPQLIQGYKNPVSGTKYRTCAMKPPSSPKWLIVPESSGALKINIEERYQGGTITIGVNFPHIFAIDMWKQNDPMRISALNSQVQANTTYTFFIEANYTANGLDYWGNLAIELTAWYDNGITASSAPADPTWALDNYRTSQFNISCDPMTGGSAMLYPIQSAPAPGEFAIHSSWLDPTAHGADGLSRRVYINVTFGPQTRVAPGDGALIPASNIYDRNFAHNDRSTWDLAVTIYDGTDHTARNQSYDEFGVQRYAALSTSGNPSASILPGGNEILNSPTYITYSTNSQYKLNVSIPNLYKNGNPASLQWIPATSVEVFNSHPNAKIDNSNLSSWKFFNAPNTNQIIWGTQITWIQPVANGTMSAGPYYSDFTAASKSQSFQITELMWAVLVPGSTQEGIYRGTITIILWS